MRDLEDEQSCDVSVLALLNLGPFSRCHFNHSSLVVVVLIYFTFNCTCTFVQGTNLSVLTEILPVSLLEGRLYLSRILRMMHCGRRRSDPAVSRRTTVVGSRPASQHVVTDAVFPELSQRADQRWHGATHSSSGSCISVTCGFIALAVWIDRSISLSYLTPCASAFALICMTWSLCSGANLSIVA